MTDVEEKTPLLASGSDTGSHSKKTYVNVQDSGDSSSDGSGKESETSKKSASFKELFRTATCLDIFLMLIGSLAACAHGSAWPVLFIFFGDMTDQFVQGVGNGTDNSSAFANMTPGEIHDMLMDEYNTEMTKYAIRYIYVGAGVFLAAYLQVSCWTTACERQVHRIRKQFFSAILRQEIGWFDVHQSGELTTRLADDLERVREGMGDKIGLALQHFAAFISGFVIGFLKGWKLALVMLSLAPVLAVCGAFLSKLMVNYTKREQGQYAKAGSVAEEVMSCIRTVTSFNGQGQDMKRYEVGLQESKKLGIKKAWVQGVGVGFTMLVMFSAYALAFWYGTEQLKLYNKNPDDGISGGTVLTVFFCVLIGTFSIGNIAPSMASVAGAKGAAAVIIDIIDNEPSIDASSRRGRHVQNVSGNIEFRGVNFSYPTRKDVPVLRNFNLSVESGQTVALVGPSGCGKSTVVNLIQRFYDPDQGEVVIDGANIRDLNLASLRRQFGVVSQEPILFGMSIRENILLGRPEASLEDIVQSARDANCHDFITDLPQGYNTLVGERGAQLSGGQKQRVAIARALIRDPKVLLLDEATSALDTASERVVQEALDKARQGRTTIVIAHRLSTIQNADVICVVKDGQIVEAGGHHDLMAQQGEYHQLVTVQMLVEEEMEDPDEDDTQKDEQADTVPTSVPRKRTISANKPERQMSRQLSKQTSRQMSKVKDSDKVDEVEQEKADNSRFCPMLRENAQEWPLIVMGCIAAAINGCTMPAFAVFFGEMISVFQNNGENSLFWSMMFLVLGGVQFLCNTIQSVSFGYSGERLTMRLRMRTFRAMLRQDVSYFDDPKHSTGALTTRLATDASLVKNATGIRIAVIIQSAFSLVAALTISFIYGWQLALAVLGCVPLMMAAGALQMKVVTGSHKRDTEELELAGKTASEATENIRTVQSLSREMTFYQKYSTYLQKPYRTNLKLAQGSGVTFAFSQGIIFMLYAGAFRLGAYLVSEDLMEASSVFKVFFAIAFTGLTIGQASSFLPDYSKAAAAAGLIFKTIRTIPLIDVFSNQGECPSKVAGSIRLRDVIFRYPTRPDVPVLKGINIDVEPGQTVALVGPSGCGKSTVVSLLQRFYDPLQGALEVDGVDIRHLNLIRLRYLISVVSQEPVLFDCSIRDNITYGLDSPIPMEDVIASARAANVHEFIVSLPLGYDTVVGEKGTQLSGGQKQRVAIARALVRNPRILLLDEATSALDTESEQLVQAALDNAQEGRTCIVIAHRLSTIQNADVIYVIDSGNVVEFGNHQQLLNKKGVYAQLVSGQQLS